LRLAIAQLVRVIHKDRRDPVNKFAGEFGIAGKMHSTEFLDRRKHGRHRLRIDVSTGSEETQAVLQGEESVATGSLYSMAKPFRSSSSSQQGSCRRYDAVLA
jgi:hypothetical protein